jgi:AcrR family transcriptional regulator
VIRRRLPPGERRALITHAAARLFAERGYAATPLEEIAAAANVTKPVLYRHFDSKKALYLALLAEHAEQLPRMAGSGSVEEMLDGVFAYVEEHPHAWKMIFRDTTGDADVQAARVRVQERARAVLVGLLAEQRRLPERELEPAAELLRTGMAGLALWWLDHPEVPRRVLVELTARVIGGVLNRPAGRTRRSPGSSRRRR